MPARNVFTRCAIVEWGGQQPVVALSFRPFCRPKLEHALIGSRVRKWRQWIVCRHRELRGKFHGGDEDEKTKTHGLNACSTTKKITQTTTTRPYRFPPLRPFQHQTQELFAGCTQNCSAPPRPILSIKAIGIKVFITLQSRKIIMNRIAQIAPRQIRIEKANLKMRASTGEWRAYFSSRMGDTYGKYELDSVWTLRWNH